MPTRLTRAFAPTLLSVSALAAQAAPLAPTSDDMLNGDGTAHTGTFDDWDRVDNLAGTGPCVGDTLVLEVERRSTSVFLSEVAFTSAVPEPATWALGSVWLLRRRGGSVR